ncbi:hypothetical protein Z948_542 [Sulfitobacter donghicola DSW-25 = KCTC 12864 = JCM 14565]|nr:hypothetical protein Z948_542 [Sulfitobacter donghicola DSW-25 = KCTC 12864 = JCM 14565]
MKRSGRVGHVKSPLPVGALTRARWRKGQSVVQLQRNVNKFFMQQIVHIWESVENTDYVPES